MSFSPTTTAQPGKFFAALSDFVSKRVDLNDQRAPVALCDFVFGYDFTIVHEFCGHALWVDYFNVITHQTCGFHFPSLEKTYQRGVHWVAFVRSVQKYPPQFFGAPSWACFQIMCP
jgi:hypothetical protein